MQGLLLLSWKHVLHHRMQTIILTLCIAIAITIPLTSAFLVSDYQNKLVARAEATPLIAGARGNRFDLTLSTLYFRATEIDPIPFDFCKLVTNRQPGIVVPVNTRFTARKSPLVGIGFEYFDLRGLQPRTGILPTQMGDVVLGASLAEMLALKVGDDLYSDQLDVFDISKPSALKMNVCGVLEYSHTADDFAAFTDIKTIWILEGLAHGHQDPTTIEDETLLLGTSDKTIIVSPALIEENEINADNRDSYHLHGDLKNAPLTAVLVWPRDDKARTMLKSFVNQQTEYQMLVPRFVIDDLFAVVFRIKTLFDGLSGVLVLSTVLLNVLIILLSMKLRAREIDTLHKIGCGRLAVAQLYTIELGIILFFSCILAGVLTLGIQWVLPNLIHTL